MFKKNASGLAVLPEGTALLDWLTVDGGAGAGLREGYHHGARRCVAGISLGGIIGSLMACSSCARTPFDLVAVLPSPSAAEVYTKGSLSHVCDFAALGSDTAALETVHRLCGGLDDSLDAVVEETLSSNNNTSSNSGERGVIGSGSTLPRRVLTETPYERGVRYTKVFLDATSHIGKAPAPFFNVNPQHTWSYARRPPHVVLFGAIDDAYMPATQTVALAERWSQLSSGSRGGPSEYNVELRWWLGGHCSTVLTRKKAVRDAIVACLLGEEEEEEEGDEGTKQE